MSSVRAERLVNLVLCLLSTRQFLSAERIRATVPGYASATSDESFFRMFERDKSELRDLGVPLETGKQSVFDTIEGYRIARQDYELGEVELAADEAAAVALAARLWDSPELAGAARGALVKLRAAGVEVDEAAGAGVEPKVRASEPSFGPLLAAVQAGQVVQFEHQPSPTAEPRTRTVEPWGVVSWRGRWYLVGHDRDRDDTRCFRLSRISEPVKARGPRGAVRPPEGVDLMALVRRSAGPPPVIGVARVWVARGRALGLRRLGKLAGEQDHAGRAGDVLELELRSPETVARWVGGHGPDVVVLDPPELADAVRRGWLAAARAHAPSDPADRSVEMRVGGAAR
ncbi:helix-turn-helix transcriptional regulator [Pseudonocardia spinosispora]|uniref:helix-turn-helix transcriptional regulator n=1 Tax=Pseudonocardia spinosispora TaxID=103441 RepID=UPI000685BA25|nr:WYL domain-containing protein [Pseudonocardia spinosispora]